MDVSVGEHVPVLTQKLAERISLPPDGVMVDATVGHGGHSCLFGQALGMGGILVGLDVDSKAIQKARLRLKGLGCRVVLVRANFAYVGDVLREHGIKEVDFVLADLGLCSAQLADPEKGLSFLVDMPLDMRIDERLQTTAADIVNGSGEEELADLIYRFGQERASRKIARFIVDARRRQPVATTSQLATIVCRALGQRPHGRNSKIHPATRTFQALRIAVNSELENLQRFLACVPGLLKAKGCVAVISFHSLEDRLVKANFRDNQSNGIYESLTEKPIVPSRAELVANPRARSAKLRIASKK